MKYTEATAHLQHLWEARIEAARAREAARDAYHAAARKAGVKLCHTCDKPMPDHDHSMSCDGCNLPWGWDTPQGRRARRAAELDEQIERLRAERNKL